MFAVGRDVPALKGLVDENDVVPEFLYALPGYVVILSPAEQAEKPAWAKYDQRPYLSLRQLYLHIPHAAQPAAVTEVDDLLAPQLCETIQHSIHPCGHPMSPGSKMCQSPKKQADAEASAHPDYFIL